MQITLVNRIVLFFTVSGLIAQLPNSPHGMYCGGNQLVFEGDLEGSTVIGIITDPSGAAIPRARVQVQVQGRDKILKDFNADDNGRFHLRGLRPGEYWIGLSAQGFNLHYWSLKVGRHSGEANIKPSLSLGT